MIYKKCRRFYNGFNEFIINTVYDQIYLKIVMVYTVQRVYISYYEYDKKYIWLCSANDAILYLNEFRFPKLQVHVYIHCRSYFKSFHDTLNCTHYVVQVRDKNMMH